MSWSGTVTCRYCYQEGHNARTCPEKAEMHKRRFEQYDSAARSTEIDEETRIRYQAEADSQRATYERMTKKCIETGEKLKRKQTAGASLKKMKCSYCGKRGHTRRTCQNLKNDYAVYKWRTVLARKEWLARYQATGLGIGSLVSVETWNHGYDGKADYERRRLMGMITGIDWDRIDYYDPLNQRVFEIKTNYQLGGGQVGYRGSIDNERLKVLELAIEKGSHGSENVEVHASGAAAEPPADWLESFKPVKEAIDPKEERAWCYKWSDDAEIREAREALEIPQCAYDE